MFKVDVLIQELVQEERNQWKDMGAGSWVLHEFLLRHGRTFKSQPLPSRFKFRPQRACYWNAQEVVQNSRGRLRYAEGYVWSPELTLLILHGWAVDDSDHVIDPTLRSDVHVSSSGKSQYFGIAFSPETYKMMRPRGGGSLLDGECGYRTSWWIKMDPSFERVLEQARQYAKWP
jgi:hypothetical protein